MAVEIREMQPEDYSQVIELWRSCEGIGLSDDDSQAGIAHYLARNPGLSFVADEDGQVVGAVLVGQDGRRGYLNHLAVKPTHRGRHIGSALVESSLAALRALGIRKCHIFVYTDNQGGFAFWEKNGWEARRDLQIMSAWL